MEEPKKGLEGGMVIPLSRVKEGKRVKVAQILGGWGMITKLRELGIYEGKEISVIRNSVGPLVIEVDGSKVVIGRGMAERIMVEEVP